MPTPSKFTEATRTAVVGALKVGASRRTASATARIGEATLRRWMEQGKEAAEGSRWRRFHDDVLEAEAHPKLRALASVYDEMPGNPALSFKWLQARESGFEPPMPMVQPAVPQMIQVHLSFHDDGALSPSAVQAFIEGEAIEQDEPAEEVRALPAPGPAA